MSSQAGSGLIRRESEESAWVPESSSDLSRVTLGGILTQAYP